MAVSNPPSRLILLALAWTTLSGLASADSQADLDFFEKKIRPILVERCETCHSAAKGKTSGGLALDTRDGWMRGGDSGQVIVPGKPDESLVIRAVQYLTDGPQMPPEDKGGKLPNGEIALLVDWVSRGAPDPRVAKKKIGGMTPDEVRTWWSFQKIRRPNPPDVKNTAWPQSDLDRFILAELDKHNLSPAPMADELTLLSHVTFDLTGLPPTIAEIDGFLNDRSDTAFEHVVDRLLNSSTYGPSWARRWLDVVRYADFHDANPKARTASCEITEAWRYRDWVVDSLNSDLPYDRFIQLQISGDTLPNPSGEDVYPDGLVATTFLSNGVWDRGDADKEKIVSDMADDNIDTVGKAFLGLTLGCARCHDHKFDPVTTEDYYALAGIFYSSHILKELGIKGGEYTMNRVPMVSKAVLAKRAEQEKQLQEIQSKLEAIDQRQRYQEMTAGGMALVPKLFMSAPGSRGEIAADGTILVHGNQIKESYTVKAIAPASQVIKFVRLELLSDPSLPGHGPGRFGDGNAVVNRFSLQFNPAGDEAETRIVKLVSAKADFEQKGFAVAGAIDTKSETGWAISPLTGTNHVAVFEAAADTNIPAGSLLTFIIDQSYSENHAIGKFRLSVTDSLAAAATSTDPARPELILTRDALQKELAVPLPLAMAVEEGGMPGGLFPNIQDVPVHIRGSYTKLGDVIPRRMPRFLAGDQQPPVASGSGRKELAKWVASNDNPLTPRVIVNRIWQWHFGEGLVRTPSNFGKLGEAPTHPELLDWLATKFVDDGWSIKKLHRRILLSATYQQSSRVPREIAALDPENRWLGRFSPRRLDAEAIRDAILFVSGQLSPVVGGPADDDFTSQRRSLYVQTARWDRSSYAMLFDAANPDSSTEKRIVSTVAPQALLFLNHEFLFSKAKQLASRLTSDVPNNDIQRIRYAYRLLFGREATDQELAIAQSIIASFGADPNTAWADLAHILLCSNEFVYID